MNDQGHRSDLLAAAFEAYMDAEDISRAELARRTKYNVTSLSALLNGQQRGLELKERTKRRMESGVGWPAGTVDAILAGQAAPSGAVLDTADTVTADLLHRVAALAAELAALTARLDPLLGGQSEVPPEQTRRPRTRP